MAKDLGKIINAMDYIKAHTVEIGILGTGGNVPSLNGKNKAETKILTYAWALEFGTSKMPPIPFFRRAIEDNEEDINKYIEDVANRIIEGKCNGITAFKQIGEFIRGKVILSIQSAGNWARPLSPKYQKWKNKKYPNRAGQTLILDGFLIKSIRYRILKDKDSIYTSPWKELGGKNG